MNIQTEWLLEKDNPSVRYFTLTEVLNKPVRDRETKEAKDEIMKVGVIPRILAKQNSEGYWEEPHRFSTSEIQRDSLATHYSGRARGRCK